MTVQITTRVLPGNKIEVTDPGLQEGQDVQVTITPVPETPQPQGGRDILDFIDSLPPGPRSAATWEEFERQFQEERDAWDR